MNRLARRARLPLLAGAAVAAALWAGPGAGRVAAAGVSFGQPEASSRFGQGVTFVQPVDLAASPTRIEALVTFPGDVGVEVFDETAQAAAGSVRLRFDVRESDGHILPNTRISARWRITTSDGAQATGPEASVTYADDRFDWRTRTGSLVTIHWYEGDDAFGQRALSIAERGVSRAERLLGVTESEPIDFFVYADQAAFYDALGPGTRENVGGQADAEIRTLFALILPDEVSADWVGIVIPHELTHLVFDTAVRNPYHFPPRWLNEGLAVYLSQGYDASDRATVRAAAANGDLVPLEALTGQFPTSGDAFAQAYAESVAAVDFFVRSYGQDALVSLIRSYARGLTDDEAFEAATTLSVAQFDTRWFADLGARVPDPVGPRPAPAGPVPPGWGPGASGAPAPTAAPGATGAPGPGVATAAPAAGSEAGAQRGASAAGTTALVLTLVAVILAFAGGLVYLRRLEDRAPSLSPPAGSWPAALPVAGGPPERAEDDAPVGTPGAGRGERTGDGPREEAGDGPGEPPGDEAPGARADAPVPGP